MVIKNLKLGISVILLSSFLVSCELDVAGFVNSLDLTERLDSCDTFHFVKTAWRNLTLPNDYNFIVTTDNHIIGRDAHGLENLKTKLGTAEFVVMLGDITQSGTQTEVNRFVEIANELGVPCYPTIGNHDIFFNNWPVWRDTIGSTRYRIDSNNTTLLFLDTANAFLGEEQIDWLKNELKTEKQNIFVFSHDNLFSDALPVVWQQRFTHNIERAEFVSILVNGNSDAYFSGHIHKRIINTIRNTNFITIEAFITTQNYCRVYVNNGNISWDFEHL
jgi:predicted phosphodiesterase